MPTFPAGRPAKEVCVWSIGAGVPGKWEEKSGLSVSEQSHDAARFKAREKAIGWPCEGIAHREWRMRDWAMRNGALPLGIASERRADR
jgi:hypothetical protein